MRIAIIGPGCGISIPPEGWGSVESLIWDIAEELRLRHGCQVLIVNTPDHREIARTVNAFQPHIVHCQYDDHCELLSLIDCKHKFITSHFGYLEHPNFFGHEAYRRIFQEFVQGANKGTFTICALSPGIKQVYLAGGVVDEKRVIITPNGADDTKFHYFSHPKYPERSLYLGKIEPRKRQLCYKDIGSLYFAGPCIEPNFPTRDNPHYLGKWEKSHLYTELSHYGSLVLLSNGEADPLVIYEAMMCGLSVVTNRVSCGNWHDKAVPWLTILPDEKLDDVGFVERQIILNREYGVAHRDDIREYARRHLTWKHRVNQLFTHVYLPCQ